MNKRKRVEWTREQRQGKKRGKKTKERREMRGGKVTRTGSSKSLVWTI